MSTSRWVDKENVVETPSRILFSLQNKEILPQATSWTNAEDITMLQDSNYRRYLKQSNGSWAWRLPGAGGSREVGTIVQQVQSFSSTRRRSSKDALSSAVPNNALCVQFVKRMDLMLRFSWIFHSFCTWRDEKEESEPWEWNVYHNEEYAISVTTSHHRTVMKLQGPPQWRVDFKAVKKCITTTVKMFLMCFFCVETLLSRVKRVSRKLSMWKKNLVK